MPSKRPSPLEEPPSASSSSEESEEVEAEEDDSEEEEEQIPSAKPSAKKPSSTPSSTPQPRTHSESDEGTDSDSGSDSEPSPEKAKSSGPSRGGADPTIKPISSKPMTDNAKPKRPSSSSATAAASASTPIKPATSSKRSLELEKSEKESKQKKKKKVAGDAEEEDGHVEEIEKKQGDDSKKLFQRLWSDEDEIVILKGMLSYIKRGLSASSNLNAFLDSIKDSLHVEVTRSQLHSKVQRLKQRYMNQLNRAKNGKEPHFTRPHELKAYQLSKKIWGDKVGKEGKEEGAEANNVGADSIATDVKKSKGGKTVNGVTSTIPKALNVPESHAEATENLDEAQYSSLAQFGRSMATPPPVLGDFMAKEASGLIGNTKVKEYDQRWKKLLVAEAKIYLQRLDLAREYTKSVLDELESSDS